MAEEVDASAGDEAINELESMLDPDAAPNEKRLFGFKPVFVYAAGGGAGALVLAIAGALVLVLAGGGEQDHGEVHADAGDHAEDAHPDLPAMPAVWSLGMRTAEGCEGGFALILSDGRTGLNLVFDATVTDQRLLPLEQTSPQFSEPLRLALEEGAAPRLRAMTRGDLQGADGPERVRLVLLEEINAAIAPFYFDDILICRMEVT